MNEEEMKKTAFSNTVEKCVKVLLAYGAMLLLMYLCYISEKMLGFLEVGKRANLTGEGWLWFMGVAVIFAVVVAKPFANKIYQEELSRLTSKNG